MIVKKSDVKNQPRYEIGDTQIDTSLSRDVFFFAFILRKVLG